jgi:hypothetical protein
MTTAKRAMGSGEAGTCRQTRWSKETKVQERETCNCMFGDDRSKAWQAVSDHSRLGVDWERGRLTEDFGFTMQQFRAGQTWQIRRPIQIQKDGWVVALKGRISKAGMSASGSNVWAGLCGGRSQSACCSS